MNVILQTGDTTASLAVQYTGNDAAADAIAEYNGLMADDGVSPFYKFAPLPVDALGTLEIPDTLITASAPPPFFPASGLSNKQVAAIGAAAVVLLLLLTGKHH